ncbi:MAG: hypothetical protein ABFS42_03595 [Candidatus Krumholzibacteriota bacterium]
MIRKLTYLVTLAMLGLSTVPASAFFDNTMVSPRARAMGEASVAVHDGAHAAFLNPGNLGEMNGGEVAASYVQPFRLDFTDFFYFGTGIPLSEKWGNLGVGMSIFKVGYRDTSLLKETQISLAHGVNLYSDYHSRVDFGYALNMYQAELGQSVNELDPGSDTAFGIDLGFMMTLHKRTRLGFQVKNLNNPQIGLDEEELHRRLVAGVSYEPYAGVVTTFEFDNELGQDVQYHGGVEMAIIESFALRAGVITNPNKLTAGFGYTLKGFGVQYGFSTGGGTLDSTHQFGLNFAWGGEAQ